MFDAEVGTRRVGYGEGGACFIPRCHCGRFVKADESVLVNETTGLVDRPNGTCKIHGRVKMIFEGFIL